MPLKDEVYPQKRGVTESTKALACELTSGDVNEICELTASSALKTLFLFTEGLGNFFGGEYNRYPTESDLIKMLEIIALKNF